VDDSLKEIQTVTAQTTDGTPAKPTAVFNCQCIIIIPKPFD
jgi:hypothetical protein